MIKKKSILHYRKRNMNRSINNLKVKDLKQLAKKFNLCGYSRKKKSELIALILNKSTVKNLKIVAKKVGIKHYSKLKETT